MNEQRIAAIASIAGVSEQEVRDMINADWDNAAEHAAWLETASDEEIAGWVKAAQ